MSRSTKSRSRLLVQEDIHDAIVEGLIDRAGGVRMGDPRDPATQIAPVATEAQHAKILDYIEIAKAEGATCVLGGRAGQGGGAGHGQGGSCLLHAGSLLTRARRPSPTPIPGP